MRWKRQEVSTGVTAHLADASQTSFIGGLSLRRLSVPVDRSVGSYINTQHCILESKSKFFPLKRKFLSTYTNLSKRVYVFLD